MNWERIGIVGGVWLLIFTEFISFNWLFVPGFYQTVIDMLMQYPKLLFVFYPVFLLFVVMLCICYYKSIVTPPGFPSSLLVLHLSNQNHGYHDLEQIKLKAREEQAIKKQMRQGSSSLAVHFDEIESLQKVSYCFKCDRIKPVRTHHCKICKKCIQRMDHHCPWVGNCVGRQNHKYFIQFLFYSSSALAMIFWVVLYDYFQEGGVLAKQEQIPMLFTLLCGGSSGCLALSIGFLFITQVISLQRNLTTLEQYVEGITQRPPWKKPTFAENVEQIAGDSSWVCPTPPFEEGSRYVSVEL